MDKEIEDFEQDGFDMDHAEAEEILDDLAFYRTLLANVCMIGKPDTAEWVLIDTGAANYSKRIRAACQKRYGSAPPKAIILTHGHFDHVGSAKKLAEYWDVPIYIHPKEIDYVNGTKQYPPADPTVGGGIISLLSPIFPTKAVNLDEWVRPLPDDGELPFLADWKYILTPGHSPGHISLFRKHDRTLVAGDAITTEKAESGIAVFFALQKVHGPPAYFTHEWDRAEESVKTLAELDPEVLITGHGLPMSGELLRKQLHELAANFKTLAIPKHKREH
ncbi:MBL fold metallo-hydrolase [Radiobacillus sp. PE A8.2]|uniref:MBL fold metallo-hydrolase n=1 Tax=Radiobacillus sp. PE A8.2 TaxID=3380349 RepID=UPI0038909419